MSYRANIHEFRSIIHSRAGFHPTRTVWGKDFLIVIYHLSSKQFSARESSASSTVKTLERNEGKHSCIYKKLTLELSIKPDNIYIFFFPILTKFKSRLATPSRKTRSWLRCYIVATCNIQNINNSCSLSNKG